MSFSTKCNLEDLQVSINEQELPTNYENLVFENNCSATENKKIYPYPS